MDVRAGILGGEDATLRELVGRLPAFADAFMRGFDVLVLEDCVATFAEERDLHEASLRNLAQLFAVVAESSALDEALAG